MGRNIVETVMGAVVLLVAAFFLAFAYTSAGLKHTKGYEVSARFDRVDGLADGADVRVSGVKVGTVTEKKLDPASFLAIVRMTVDPSLKLPKDTVAEVASDGLLGGKYMALVPGGSDEVIPPGGQIQYTQASVSLENLIGQLIYSFKDKKESEKEAAKTGGQPKGDGK